nr:kinesin-like protein KIN12B [Tanacetum cinerariifolium]
MKAQDQDHTNDIERMLLAVLSMNEHSHYKQENMKTRLKKAKLKSQIISSTLRKIKVKSRYLPIRMSSVEQEASFDLLKEMMDGSRILIFVETKKGCDQVTCQFRMDEWPALYTTKGLGVPDINFVILILYKHHMSNSVGDHSCYRSKAYTRAVLFKQDAWRQCTLSTSTQQHESDIWYLGYSLESPFTHKRKHTNKSDKIVVANNKFYRHVNIKTNSLLSDAYTSGSSKYLQHQLSSKSHRQPNLSLAKGKRKLDEYVTVPVAHSPTNGDQNFAQASTAGKRIEDGIMDVKKAAAKDGVKCVESKFINALAEEISILKEEKEKERLHYRDKNKGLQAQLRDMAEAVQAAIKLLSLYS